MAPSAGPDLNAFSPPVRIPKLKYRNPLPSTVDSASSDNLVPAQPALPSPTSIHHVTLPLDKADSSSFSATSLTSPSLASTTSSQSSHGSTSEKKKKKKSSVLGFLSLKEPSQVALEQFAEQQRKSAATKGGNSSPSSRPADTFVGKQLPANVPKVNSKWDGVPDTARHSKRMSTLSSSTSSTKDRNSLSSRGSIVTQFRDLPSRDSKATGEVPKMPDLPHSTLLSDSSGTPSSRDGSTPSPTRFPEMVNNLDNGPVASGALPVEAILSSDIEKAIELPVRSSEESEFNLGSDSGGDFRSSSPASSTTSVDTIVRDTADTIFKKLNDRPRQDTLWDNPAPAILTLEAKVPESHDFLFAPPTVEQRLEPEPEVIAPALTVPHYVPTRPMQNFSRPMAGKKRAPAPRPQAYRAVSAGVLPTVYEASLASTDDISVNEDSPDDEYDDDNEDAQSMAPSTIAPSELSQVWHESSRDRLGLGGKLRVDAVLPWDNPNDQTSVRPKKNRLSWLSGISTHA